MYTVSCSYQPTAYGPIFLPRGKGNYDCTLRIQFGDLAWLPADRDAGIKAQLDAEVADILMYDTRDRHAPTADLRWRPIEDEYRQRAQAYVEKFHCVGMWRKARELAQAAYGASV